jgi:hypothetical protein
VHVLVLVHVRLAVGADRDREELHRQRGGEKNDREGGGEPATIRK